MQEVQTEPSLSVDPLFPLEAFSDYVVHQLPEANVQQEVAAIREGKRHLPDMARLEHIAYQEPYHVKMVAMGDLGMFLVSCLKAGINLKEIPTVVDQLELLSLVTGVVPRDTYATYVTYNPPEALRTFSAHPSEVGFIQQHRLSDEAMKPAAEAAFRLQNEKVDQATRLMCLKEIQQGLQGLKQENKAVHQKVDPKYFIRLFRDYFFPITLHGQEYQAPSGVHIANIILVDIIVGTANDGYFQTTEELLPYLEPRDRWKIQQAMHRVSLKTRLMNQYQEPWDTEEMRVVIDIYKMLKHFRYVHQGLVNRYIRKQDTGVTHGTGGFSFDEFLLERIEITEATQREVQKAVEEKKHLH
ncbi:monodechloroaminopyrrolnitrin synthase PrnB family protein [Thalassobacillus pellis]|uniref:monodechloroaminopyrrolnitrin synthase PrnB family protein n=1 Tax=Thalassobacillus pellis TaxID=748008 RepID=UPI001960072A|nr:monodechloroaminopyrrolnitrin synthase PrnB family protein [Thalassobacillus pellis]MBM7554565.1 hypothetical protein [Thalassobacillus pellis]